LSVQYGRPSQATAELLYCGRYWIGTGCGGLVDWNPPGRSAGRLRVYGCSEHLLRLRQEPITNHCEATHDERVHQSRFVTLQSLYSFA